jgi:spore germination protein YaaH
MRKVFFSFLYISGILFGQVYSNLQFESELHSDNYLLNTTSQQSIGVTKLNKIVFGYLPDWEYVNGTHNNIRYDLISHLAVFPFQADASGNLTDPANWPWNDVINAAKVNGVKLIATITNFNGDDIHSLFTDQIKRNNLFANIKSKLISGGFNGVNIDFENVKDTDKATAIANFLSQLKSFLPANYEISFASPAINFGGWNFSGIAQNCDFLFVMFYDFYGSWSSTTGPSSPFNYIINSNTGNSFSLDYKDLIASSPQKLILGVPYFGNYWKTKTENAYTPVDTTKAKKEFVSTLRYKEIFPTYQSKNIMWDDLSKTRWLKWQDVSSWNQIWYDDDSSLALKYDYAIQKKLGGIGIWALGYDDGRQELWKLIERKFTDMVDVKNEGQIIPSTFQLFQNYPNPFNPETVISYQLSAVSYVSLKVYDMFGREVATLVDEIKQPGVYHSSFSVLRNPIPSGIYFYTLKAGSYSYSMKMLLIK